MTINFSTQALRQLEDIYEYLGKISPRAAARVHKALLDDIERLTSQPLMGHVEPLLDDLAGGYRSLFVGKRYKAVYRIEGEIVLIITLHDCRRNPARLRRRVIADERSERVRLP